MGKAKNHGKTGAFALVCVVVHGYAGRGVKLGN